MEAAQAMREISLREYQRSPAHTLAADERDMLKVVLPSATIETAAGAEGIYHLTPGSVVGAVEVGALSVLIAHKIGIPNLLSLACYAISRVRFGREEFEYPEEYALPDVLAMALATQARRAFSSGLLHGYRPEEQALLTVRGRINVEEQLRRRFYTPLPAELQYDEFTDGILANQLVKASAYRLGRLRVRSPKARESLGWVAGMLAEVSLVEFRPPSVPVVKFDRLNGHYRRVVELSRLILRQGRLRVRQGPGSSLGVSHGHERRLPRVPDAGSQRGDGSFRAHPASDRGVGLTLDYEEQVALRPDQTWWDGSSCTFVGDAKYKNVIGERVPNADPSALLCPRPRPAGRPAGLRPGRDGHGDAQRAPLRQKTGGCRARHLPFAGRSSGRRPEDCREGRVPAPGGTRRIALEYGHVFGCVRTEPLSHKAIILMASSAALTLYPDCAVQQSSDVLPS